MGCGCAERREKIKKYFREKVIKAQEGVMKLLCKILGHRWKYHDITSRRKGRICGRCYKVQIKTVGTTVWRKPFVLQLNRTETGRFKQGDKGNMPKFK